MNGEKIINLAKPTGTKGAATKGYVDIQNAKQDIAISDKASKAYVDGEIAKIPQTDTSDLLKLDGSRSMTGDLDMNNNSVINIPTRLSSANTTPSGFDGFKKYAAYHEDLHHIHQNLTRIIVNYYLRSDGATEMTGNLEMEFTDSNNITTNSKVVGLGDPTDSRDAANKEYVDSKISKVPRPDVDKAYVDKAIEESEERAIESIDSENVFKKVMDDDLFKEDDDDIHQIGVVNKNYHKINQKTYHFQIDYDSSLGYYSTRLSIDVVYLPVSTYTLVYEMYIDDGSTVDEINASSGTLSVRKINSKIVGNKTRSVIHFTKNTINPGFDDLDINIRLKGKTDPKTDIYVVVYGVKGYQNDVSIHLWDRLYYFDNDVVNFEAPINMNNKQIKNLFEGNEDSDAINLEQLNDFKNSFQTSVSNLQSSIGTVHSDLQTQFNRNGNLTKAIYRNLIRNDSKLLLIKKLYFPDSNEGRTENNYSYQTNGDNKGYVTFYLTFAHKASTSDSMIITLHWDAFGSYYPINIFISKDRVASSRNSLINEPSLKVLIFQITPKENNYIFGYLLEIKPSNLFLVVSLNRSRKLIPILQVKIMNSV